MKPCSFVAFAMFAIVAATPGLVQAACTQQDAQAKAMQLNQLVQTKMQQDPSQGQALMAKMQPIMMANQQTGTAVDLDKMCSEYDALIQQAR